MLKTLAAAAFALLIIPDNPNSRDVSLLPKLAGLFVAPTFTYLPSTLLHGLTICGE
jgi:hypothetical protein